MKVIGFADLKEKYGIPYSRIHLRRLSNVGKFPKPIQLGGGRAIAWIETEVEIHLAELAAARGLGAPPRKADQLVGAAHE
jgi:predicted DNA-binding transcriptional regulator AlpA